MCRQLDAEADDQAAAQKLAQANAYMVRLEATLQQQSAVAQEAAAELERLRSREVEVSTVHGLGLGLGLDQGGLPATSHAASGMSALTQRALVYIQTSLARTAE